MEPTQNHNYRSWLQLTPTRVGENMYVAPVRLALVKAKPAEVHDVTWIEAREGWYKPVLVSNTEPVKRGDIAIDVRDKKLFEAKDELENHWQDGVMQYQKSYCLKVIANNCQIPDELFKEIREGRMLEGKDLFLKLEVACMRHRSLTTNVDAPCRCGIPQIYQTVLKDNKVAMHHQEK